jgi:hypothetical protein
MSELAWRVEVCETERGTTSTSVGGTVASAAEGWPTALGALVEVLREQRRRATCWVTVADETALVIPGLTPSGDMDLAEVEHACSELARAMHVGSD